MLCYMVGVLYDQDDLRHRLTCIGPATINLGFQGRPQSFGQLCLTNVVRPPSGRSLLLFEPPATFPDSLDVLLLIAPPAERGHELVLAPAVDRMMYGPDTVGQLLITEVGELVA